MYVMLEISRRYDVKPFLKSHVRVDLRNRISPRVATKTADLCSVLQLLAESPVILRIVKIAHRPAANAANSLPMWAHLLRDRTQHRLDWKTVAMFGTNLLRTAMAKFIQNCTSMTDDRWEEKS